jgi:hypothetical protein
MRFRLLVSNIQNLFILKPPSANSSISSEYWAWYIAEMEEFAEGGFIHL